MPVPPTAELVPPTKIDPADWFQAPVTVAVPAEPGLAARATTPALLSVLLPPTTLSVPVPDTPTVMPAAVTVVLAPTVPILSRPFPLRPTNSPAPIEAV